MSIEQPLHSNNQISDRELALCIQSGDIQAFNEVVKRYSQKLCGVIYSIIRDEEESNDILQEVFIKVYDKSYQFQGQSSFLTWMTRIAINLSFNHAKKKI